MSRGSFRGSSSGRTRAYFPLQQCSAETQSQDNSSFHEYSHRLGFSQGPRHPEGGRSYMRPHMLFLQRRPRRRIPSQASRLDRMGRSRGTRQRRWIRPWLRMSSMRAVRNVMFPYAWQNRGEPKPEAAISIVIDMPTTRVVMIKHRIKIAFRYCI